jgi:hypothetical protein
MNVFSSCYALPPYVEDSSDALLEMSESALLNRLSITSGLKGCTPIASKELQMLL